MENYETIKDSLCLPVDEDLVDVEYDTIPNPDEFDEYVNFILDENDRIVSGLFEQD